MTALVACSPLAAVTAFVLVLTYIIGDGIHQAMTNPAKRHPLSKGVQRRRASGKW